MYQSIVNIFNGIFKGVSDLVFGASLDEANSTSIRYNARQSAIDDIMNFYYQKFNITIETKSDLIA